MNWCKVEWYISGDRDQKAGKIHERASTWGDAATDTAFTVAAMQVIVPLATYYFMKGFMKGLIAPNKAKQEETDAKERDSFVGTRHP